MNSDKRRLLASFRKQSKLKRIVAFLRLHPAMITLEVTIARDKHLPTHQGMSMSVSAAGVQEILLVARHDRISFETSFARFAHNRKTVV